MQSRVVCDGEIRVFFARDRVKGCGFGSVFLSAQSAETCKSKGIEM